jgi:transcriptional regulator with XRE-family HTH domain
MGDKSGGPAQPPGSGPLEEFDLAHGALNGAGDVPRVAGDADVLAAREPLRPLPLPNGSAGDPTLPSDGGAGDETHGEVEGVAGLHDRDSKTVGYTQSSTRGYAEADDTADVVPPPNTFWFRLLEAMRDRGLPQTQVAAAKLGGVTPPAARKWAEGGLPDVDKILDIAKRLDVSLDWLLRGEGPKRPPRHSETDPHFERLLNIWADIDPDARKRLVDFADLIPPSGPKKDRT